MAAESSATALKLVPTGGRKPWGTLFLRDMGAESGGEHRKMKFMFQKLVNSLT